MGGERNRTTARWPTVAGYEILGILGRGGMGIVYQARQQKLKRVVALKMILAGVHASEGARLRFRTEAEAVARLQHPHIVQVFEVGEADGSPFISLEFVNGGSLAGKLNGSPQPVRESALLVQTLAQAIHHAHRHEIIHRDLKPGNVLLRLDLPEEKEATVGRAGTIGSPPTGPPSGVIAHFGMPKIADFGLAKQLDSQGEPTQCGSPLGTPTYMAPEQAEMPGEKIGPGVDIYALGTILYELLTGRPPFRGATPLDTLEQVRSQEAVPPSRLQPKVPRDLETICLKCLHKSPRGRYLSAGDLADDLGNFLAGKPIRARRVSATERLWRWGRRNPTVAGLVAALLLVFVLGFGAAIWQMRQAQANARAEAAAREEADDQRKTAEARELQAILARKDADAQHREAQKQRLAALREAATSRLDHGLTRCEKGDVAHGLLLLADSLEKATRAGADDLQYAIRFSLAAWSRQVVKSTSSPAHGTPVTAVAFSPSGKTVATGTWGNAWNKPQPAEVLLWETDTWKRLGQPMPHPAPVWGLAFSPDGKTLATACWDGEVRLWDTGACQTIGPPLRHPHKVQCVALSPDGQTIVTGCWDGAARLWNVASGDLIGQPLRHLGQVWSVAFRPDGKVVLSASLDGMVRLWDLASGQLKGSFTHPDPVCAAAFRPDGKAVLTACDDHTARVWETGSGRRLGLPLSCRYPVKAVAFSPDGQTMVTGAGWHEGDRYGQGEIRFWDATTSRPLGVPIATGGLLHALAFSPDGKRVLAGSEDGMARLWEVAGDFAPAQTLRHEAPLIGAAFSADGKTLLTVADTLTDPARGEARLRNGSTGEPLGPALPYEKSSGAVLFNPGGKTVLLPGADGARLWDAVTGEPIGSPLPQTGHLYHAVFTPDGTVLLTIGQDKAACLWEAATGRRIGQIPPQKDVITGAVFSPDGKAILTRLGNRTLQKWLTNAGQPLGPPLTLDNELLAFSFSPDGKLILTLEGSSRGVRLWEADTGKRLAFLQTTPGTQVMQASFSPDGSVIQMYTRQASDFSSDYSVIQLWDVATGRRIGFSVPQVVGQTAFHPGGRLLATGETQVAQVRDVATGRPLGPPLPHRAPVNVMAFTPDGRLLLTLSSDRTGRLWAMPAPVEGEPAQVKLWVQALTGRELDEAGSARPLDVKTLEERRARLVR
jgi:WD40 repeat protein/serine/threonine protein kinase